MNRYKQGSQCYCLIVMLSISMTMTGCSQASSPAHTHTVGADEATTWIGHNALPLKTVEPGGSDADLLFLEHLVGNASIVGLGEETHGTHEFFGMKARIAEFLISHLGFTTFIMENDWGPSRLVDAYINGGSETIGDVMQQSLFPAWQTQEYRDMLEWMRAYNTSPTHTTKIHFFGMDIQKASQGDFDTVYTYVHMVDPQQTALVQQLYSQSPGPAGRRPAACSPASIRKPPIATSLYQGVYNIHPGGSYPVPTVLPGTPGKDTYNYTLGNVSIPLYLLDLRKTPPGPVTDWANGPHIFLEYGISGEYLSIPGSLQQWFDLIVFIRHTTASRSLLYL